MGIAPMIGGSARSRTTTDLLECFTGIRPQRYTLLQRDRPKKLLPIFVDCIRSGIRSAPEELVEVARTDIQKWCWSTEGPFAELMN
jgi:hypothetical protein